MFAIVHGCKYHKAAFYMPGSNWLRGDTYIFTLSGETIKPYSTIGGCRNGIHAIKRGRPFVQTPLAAAKVNITVEKRYERTRGKNRSKEY